MHKATHKLVASLVVILQTLKRKTQLGSQTLDTEVTAKDITGRLAVPYGPLAGHVGVSPIRLFQ